MRAIDRIKQKYMEQHPMRNEQFAVPPDWVEAVAAVLDEMLSEIAKLKPLPGNNPPKPPAPPKGKQRQQWSPAARAAAAERMRQRIADGKMKKRGKAKKETCFTPARGGWGFSGPQQKPSEPPGESTTYTDEEGRAVTRCPPGYAIGATPDHRVRPTGERR